MKTVAFVYWIFVAAAYFLDFVVCIVATMPWSYLVFAWQMPLAGSHPLVKFLNSRAGGFLVLPLLCGGINVAILIGLSRSIRWWWNRRLPFEGD